MRRAKKIENGPRLIILWGGTGQAKVVRPIIEHWGGKVIAVFDDNPNLKPPFDDIPLYYGKKDFEKWMTKNASGRYGFCISIGNPFARVRLALHERLTKRGLRPATIIHPTAQIADNAVIGEGCQFMAGAIVNPLARLGRECIINTKASVDHECSLADGVELAPGATLCGHVIVGANTWICAGATILPRITIGANSIIGAGAVVIRNVPGSVTVVGVPANRVISRRK